MASSTTDTPSIRMEEELNAPNPNLVTDGNKVAYESKENEHEQPDSSNIHSDKNSVEAESSVETMEEAIHQSNRRAPLRFLQVEGIEGRTNDLIYCAPLQSEIIIENGVESTSDHRPHQRDFDDARQRKREKKSNTNQVVIFFGGDIQVSICACLLVCTLYGHLMWTININLN